MGMFEYSHDNGKTGPPKIYFLISVYAQYWGGLFKAIINIQPGTEIVVVHFDRLKSGQISQAISQDIPARFIKRSSLDRKGLLRMLQADMPSIIYISGWVDKDYLHSARKYRAINKHVSVVCGIDDQWKGTLRQYLGVVFFAIFYRRIFNFMWVSGKPQYHYAERFGYNHCSIISNLLSAESVVFDEKTEPSRRFVFVGRFVRVKGLDVLLKAYKALPGEIKKNWSLVLIGDGPERDMIQESCRVEENIYIKPFMSQEVLLQELKKGGVCCMPSRFESWGVAIHEMALLGYPLIVSSACGAATEFLISGYNGYLFRSEDVESLRDALQRMASLSDETLKLFSTRSSTLGRRINNELSAYSLLSTQYLVDI